MVLKRENPGFPAGAAAALLAAFALAGCEVYAVPSPLSCPGDRIGTFNFAGDEILPVVVPPAGTGCFFADPTNPANQAAQSIAFTGSFYFGQPATPQPAALCINAPHALPRIGTVAPDGTIDVSYVNVGASIGGCTCPSTEAVTAGRCACPPNTPTSGCSCPVVITETIRGALQRNGQGILTGFTGTQAVSVTPPPGVVAGAVCDCQVACDFAYDLAATVVGAP